MYSVEQKEVVTVLVDYNLIHLLLLLYEAYYSQAFAWH